MSECDKLGLILDELKLMRMQLETTAIATVETANATTAVAEMLDAAPVEEELGLEMILRDYLE